ncbi:MAG: hypothetical protein KF891_02175 [Rhizobacter sp.]|nr:hypothetical protein [Rhizobacter sp.]
MRHRHTDFSLVELMVGMAIGLVIVSVALLAWVHHLRENRLLLLDTRLMQDLRTAADLVSRDLRRAGLLLSTADGVRFSDASGSQTLAYRLHDDVIEMKIGNGHWQALTDAGTLRVSAFRVAPRTHDIVLEGFCSKACVDGRSPTCPPRQVLRDVDIDIDARAASDTRLARQVRSTVHLRQDALVGACPA